MALFGRRTQEKEMETIEKQEFPARKIEKEILVFVPKKDWRVDGETKDFIIIKKEPDLPF